MRNTHLPILLTILTLGPSGPSVASEEGSRALLLFGPGSANADGTVAYGYVRERLPARERPDERVGVTGIPFPTDETYGMTGTGRVRWCSGGESGDLGDALSEAREALDLLESDRVEQIVDAQETRLPCMTEAVDSEMLAELYLIRGLAAFVDGHTGAARDDFAAASGIFPDLRWDVGYPPETQQTYLVAREEALAAETARFGFSGSLVAGLRLSVDGREIEMQRLHKLTPGPHLVQLHTGDGVVSALLRIEPGQTSVLVDRFGATAAALGGPTSDLSRAAATTVLDALATQWNVGTVFVVDTTYRRDLHEPASYRYDVGDKSFEKLTAIRNLTKHMPRYADRLRIGVTARVGGEGGPFVDDDLALQAPGPHLLVAPMGSVEIRIGSGFTPRGELRIPLHTSGGGKVVVAPELCGSFGYRWRPRFVQTFVGAALRGRFNALALGEVTGRYPVYSDADNDGDGAADPSDLDLGLGLDVIIDIVTPRLPVLFFRIEGSVTFYTSASRATSVGAGLGLRI